VPCLLRPVRAEAPRQYLTQDGGAPTETAARVATSAARFAPPEAVGAGKGAAGEAAMAAEAAVAALRWEATDGGGGAEDEGGPLQFPSLLPSRAAKEWATRGVGDDAGAPSARRVLEPCGGAMGWWKENVACNDVVTFEGGVDKSGSEGARRPPHRASSREPRERLACP
jgi:hypothetical protein